MQDQDKQDKKEQGFTLIELLVAIVVVGILTAVAIVGIGGLTDNGKTSACKASRDAANAAAAVYYANHSTYASTFTQLDGDGALDVSNVDITGGTPAGTVMKDGTNWSVTMSGGGATPTAITACPAA
jgi:prepilin-type N-terminal cleavage/methylation domain-containing protein